jgi:putative addiction module killer protein
MSMPEVRFYVAPEGDQPFAAWLEHWTRWPARGSPERSHGSNNFSNVKSVGEGALEYRIDFGPGYRVYFGRDGEALVILLTGGTKKRQQRDIEAAQGYWQTYKQSKRARR